jgi:hypothetical protein
MGHQNKDVLDLLPRDLAKTVIFLRDHLGHIRYRVKLAKGPEYVGKQGAQDVGLGKIFVDHPELGLLPCRVVQLEALSRNISKCVNSVLMENIL